MALSHQLATVGQILLWLIAWLTTAHTLADTAVWKPNEEGDGTYWRDANNWIVDGDSTVPGTGAVFWNVTIDDSDSDVNVFLEKMPTPPHIHALNISDGDTLQINGSQNLLMLTDGLEQGGNIISNSGTLAITQRGVLVLQGNNTPNPDDNVVTLSGGGIVSLGSQSSGSDDFGARITGQGGMPRILVNEDNIISGTGNLGFNELRIINRGEVVANEPQKTLTINPRSENPTMFAGFTNDGGTVRATGKGIVRLASGTLVNVNDGKFIAEGDSVFEIIFAHITGGTLMSTSAGRFRVLNNSSFTGEANNKLTIAGSVDIQNDAELTLRGEITNSGDISVNAANIITSILIDGDVTVDGGGRIRINSSIPNLALGGIAPVAPGVKLTIGEDQEISGVGTVGSGALMIDNQGTIAANQKGRTLFVNPSPGTDVSNSGLFNARNGGTLALQKGWNLSGTRGEIRSSFSEIFDDGPSVVLLDGVKISGQRLQTPDNPTASPSAAIDDIDPGKGVIRTRNLSTTFDLRDSPPINEGLLDIADASRLSLQSKTAAEGATAPAFENAATVLLNALPGGVAELWVSGGDVRLTGGGQIVLSDDDGNRIDQSATEARTHSLINVDNLIVGAGNIGNRRLNLVNESGGTIIGDGDNPLVIETPLDVDAINRGVISANPDATLILRNTKFTNEIGARLQSRRSGTLKVERGTLTNNGTVVAEGLDGMNATAVIENTVVLNYGVIEATGGSKVEIRSSGIANLVGMQPGTTGPVLGTIAARGASVVELLGTTIITGGVLESSDESRIRVVDRNVGFVLPIINAAMLEISDGARATIVGEEVEFGGSVTVRSDLLTLTNTATITLNADQGTSQIRVLGGFNRLAGGGEILLSDDPGNSITPVLGRSALVNEDNTIRGAGDITVALRNRDDGRIIADGTNRLNVLALSDFTLAEDDAPELREFSGLFNRGLIRAQGTGGIQLVHENAASDGFIPAINAGRMEVAAGSKLEIVDQGPVPAFLNVGAIFIEGSVQGGSTTDGRMTVTTLQNRRPRSDMMPGPPDSIQSDGGIIVIDGRFDGTLRNDGIVTGTGDLNGSLVGAGKFRPGDSPGTFNITGRYEQLPGGELEVELAGMNVGEQYDQVIVDGEAVFGGVVVVKHLDGFAPQSGADFDVVSATTLVDNGFTLAMLDGGLARPNMVDVGDGTMALRLTSIEGVRYAPENGSWDEAANWSSGAVPGMDDTPWILGNPSADTTVDAPAADTSVFSLLVGSGDAAATSVTTLELGTSVVATTRGTTLRRDAQLTGSGTLGGDLYSAGTIAAGHVAGAIHIAGHYTQNEIGTLAVEIAGTTPGQEFDQFTVAGIATLAGILDVSFVNLGDGLFEPALDDVFTILTADQGVAGGFDTVILPPLEAPLAWEVEVLPNSVELRVAMIPEPRSLALVIMLMGIYAASRGTFPSGCRCTSVARQ